MSEKSSLFHELYFSCLKFITCRPAAGQPRRAKSSESCWTEKVSGGTSLQPGRRRPSRRSRWSTAAVQGTSSPGLRSGNNLKFMDLTL